MKYRVYYWDEPGAKDVVIEAPDHRSAAKQFFSQRPRIEHCRIRVESKGFWIDVKDFDATEFMDETTRASLPPLPPAPAAEAPSLSRKPRPTEMRVVVTDINMRFSSMIVFMIKWAFAAIPAIIIIFLIMSIIIGITGLGLLTHK